MESDSKLAQLQGQLTLEYFKSIREEIHLRLEQHNKLWFQKVATCGVVLSFALSNTGIGVYGCALVPYIAIVFDLLLVNNLGVIHYLGQYIATVIERKYLPNGWETLSRESSKNEKKKPFGKIDWLLDWMVIVLFTLALYCLSLFVAIHNNLIQGSSFMIALFIIAFVTTVGVCAYSRKHLLHEPEIVQPGHQDPQSTDIS